MKRILIIGAGFLQSFIIKKAKTMGYYTIAIDKNPNSPGFKYANEFGVIDIVNEEACFKFAQLKEIDGVITAATDYGVLSASYVAEKMNLPGLEYKVAKVIKNKYEVRRILSAYKIDDVSQFFEITDLNNFKKISGSINFPVMVKPCDGSGSKAAKRVDSVNDLKEACEAAINASLSGKALIEDFIVGKEFGVESFVHEGKVHVLGILDKYMTDPPFYAELGHSMPAQINIESKIKEVVINAINVLGINKGSVNMDILVTQDDRICIIDIGARMGGNLIGSHIIPMSTGIDYTGTLIRSAVGDLLEFPLKKTHAKVATRLLALKPGRVKSLPNFKEIEKEFKVEIYHHLKIDREIKEYQTNLDGLGYIISKSDDIKLAVNQAEEVRATIDNSILRK